MRTGIVSQVGGVVFAILALTACCPTAFAQSPASADPADLSAPLAALKDLSSEITWDARFHALAEVEAEAGAKGRG
jgi:hypothetical protein